MALTDRTIALNSKLVISRVITGLWQIADMERNGNQLDHDQLASEMKKYADEGLTTFDMADHYGSAEDIAGCYVRAYGQQQPVQLLTKWVPEPGRITLDKTREAINKSRKRLNVESLDLLQFHAWNYADPSWLDALFYLKELKEEGLIKNLGVTNFDTAHLRVAVKSGIPLVTNQVCYSLLDQRAAQQMTQFCLENGIHLLAFGTLAGGFLSDEWLGKPEPELNESLTWSQMKYKRFIDTAGGWQKFQALLRALHHVALAHHTSIANLATRFILAQPAVAAAIVGARLGQREHRAENQQLNAQPISTLERDEIVKALNDLEMIPGDCGDEYRKPPFLTASGDLSHHVASFPKPFETRVSGERALALSGTIWEELASFCRAVRKGNRIFVSGTTATHGQRLIGGSDPAAQAHFVIDKIEGALQSLGGKLSDTVRTRIFVKNLDDWEVVARAHGERFRQIQPANTLIQGNLVGDEYLVEMEAEAIVDG